jgi:hypothetical protein
MKKLLITIGGLMIMAFVVVLFVNAADSKKDPKKAKTEAAAPCSATCTQTAGANVMPCDPAKCKDMKCDAKGGKCDPANCKEMKCDPAKCKGMCKKTGTDMKSCDPAKCPEHLKTETVK